MGRIVVLWLALAGAASNAIAADLTALESRWLQGLWPVVNYAKAQRLPLDVVVQPQPTPGSAPLALGYVGGRCKLVLSMRGNAEAEATLQRLEPELLAPTLELMAAHELGHCARYLEGAWYNLPAGFTPPPAPDGLAPAQREAYLDMKAERREEAYGDLVGLAWTRERHPGLYRRLQAWLSAERSHDVAPGSPHDTLHWVALAEDVSALEGGSLFEAATRLWRKGLATAD